VTDRANMEASGHARWFERLLHNFEFELWISFDFRFPSSSRFCDAELTTIGDEDVAGLMSR